LLTFSSTIAIRAKKINLVIVVAAIYRTRQLMRRLRSMRSHSLEKERKQRIRISYHLEGYEAINEQPIMLMIRTLMILSSMIRVVFATTVIIMTDLRRIMWPRSSAERCPKGSHKGSHKGSDKGLETGDRSRCKQIATMDMEGTSLELH